MLSFSLKIDIKNAGLTSIPTPTTAESTWCTHLKLDDNFIYNINTNSFALYPNLELLGLRNNSIETVAENAFNGLNQLRYLSLETNNIQKLPNSPGFPFQSLEWCILWNALKDDVTHSYEEPYFSAFTSLKTLDLGSNEQGSNFNTSILPGTLTYFRLTSSQISKFPDFSHLGSLETLKIDKNNLAHIPLENVKTLSKLRELDIQLNVLTYIADISFMTELDILRINSNQLNTIPDLYDTDFTFLEIADNPLECNQSLCWIRMWPWMKTPVLQDNPICASPSAIQGIALMDLPPTYLQCYNGKLHKGLSIPIAKIRRSCDPLIFIYGNINAGKMKS